MTDDLLERLFPALKEAGFEVTSPRDTGYNCVAWAAGDTTRWWWPAEFPFAYWPAGVERKETLTSFIHAFATLGYEYASSGEHESEFEKVAIFASRDGVPTHVARQLGDGSWTSKLGGLAADEKSPCAELNAASAFPTVREPYKRMRTFASAALPTASI
jgi:hypothetical protein